MFYLETEEEDEEQIKNESDEIEDSSKLHFFELIVPTKYCILLLWCKY